MVQNIAKKRRGRPRAYDPDAALAGATGAFWDTGYAATSLDDLSLATGMNRPSLYGAFGDKRALYLQTLGRYRDQAKIAMQATLKRDLPLREGLRKVYAKALSLYFSGDSGARGCFLIGTAATEAVADAGVRDLLGASLREFDAAFEARFQQAREHGEIDRGADPAALAKLASAVLHTLAVRSRAGDPRAELEAVADAGVSLLCGAVASGR